MKIRLPVLKGSLREEAGTVRTPGDAELIGSGILAFSSRIGSTCDLGVQTIALTPGASSTCGGGNCSCCSSCCW